MHENEEDLRYVNALYDYSNEKPSGLSWFVFILASLIITCFIVWAAIAQIDELARANGKVIPSGKIQTIQSYDGGIVSEILVKEGQVVEKDDPLLKIDLTRFQASLEENVHTYLNLLAKKVRLDAEGHINLKKIPSKLKFDERIIKDKARYDISEQKLFEKRVYELKSSVKVLQNQLGQKRQELKEISSTIKNLRQNLKFIKEQRNTMKRLVKSRIKSKYDLLNIEKEYNKTSGDLETAKLSVPRSKLAIAEAKNRIDEKLNTFKRESTMELNKISNELNKIEAKLISDTDKVNKTVIKSSVNGIIKHIYTNTIGGVIKPGMDIIEIVPLNANLLVEAKVDPKDIAFINPSLKAIIKLTAYDFSIYGGLEGEIIEISADSIVDKDSKEGKSYYRILVKTDKNYLEKGEKKLPIIPGMVASVDIITGKKTILDFILKPILKIKQNAFRER